MRFGKKSAETALRAWDILIEIASSDKDQFGVGKGLINYERLGFKLYNTSNAGQSAGQIVKLVHRYCRMHPKPNGGRLPLLNAIVVGKKETVPRWEGMFDCEEDLEAELADIRSYPWREEARPTAQDLLQASAAYVEVYGD